MKNLIAYIPTDPPNSPTPPVHPPTATPAPGVVGFFGKIVPPEPFATKYGSYEVGLMKFANNILKFVIVVAGIFAFLNIIIAGYEFLGAGGDAKKVEAAWKKIWQSLLGLAFVAGSFVLAAIFGWLIFKDPRAILSPQIFGPND